MGREGGLGLISERSCRSCKYDTEGYEQGFCTLHSGIVTEFVKEHCHKDFKILNNWFMGLDPCDYYDEDQGSTAYGALEKEVLENLGEVCVDLWEGTPGYNQLYSILLEFRAFAKITPWETEDGPFTTSVSKIWCLPLIQYKRLRKLQRELKCFLDSAKQSFDVKIYGPPTNRSIYINLEPEEEASG